MMFLLLNKKSSLPTKSIVYEIIFTLMCRANQL